MSIDAMKAVRDFSRENGPRLLLLLMIADSTNDGEGYSRIGMTLLCNRARVQRVHAHKYLRDLEDEGELVVVERPGKANMFYIPILPGEIGYDPQPCEGVEDGIQHWCNHEHTPISVNRALLTDKAVQAARVQYPRKDKKSRGYDSVEGEGVQKRTGYKNVPQGVQKRTPTPYNSVPPGGTNLYPNPNMIPNTIPSVIPSRANTTNLAENLETAEPEPDPAPPLPPLTPVPDMPEARLAWREVRNGMVGRVGQNVVNAWGTQCHLYELEPGVWQLRLGTGIPVSMFRARFEDYITAELCKYQHAGNQILQIVGAG